MASSAQPDLSRRRIYELGRCRVCGTAALVVGDGEPEPDALYEGGTYRPVRRRLDSGVEVVRRLIDRDRLRLLGHLPPGSRVFEVGAGRGRLLTTLSADGHHASGVEPSAALWEAARRQGAQVKRLALEQVRRPPGSCDVVVLWHVLEHLEDPAAALRRVRPWLDDAGRLVVAVPNLASLQARIGGDRWFHQDLPRHRTQFTVGGLTRLLRRTGFAPVRIRWLMLDQGLIGMWLALLSRLTSASDVPFRYVKRDLSYVHRRDAVRDAVATLLLGPLLLPVALGLELGAALARQGGSVVIEACSYNAASALDPEEGPD